MNPFLERKTNTTEIDNFLTSILVNESSNWSEYKIRKLNENSKMKAADRVVSKLFKTIRDRALHLDFTEIDKSKGNVANLTCYKDLVNAIKFLKNLTLSNNKSVKNNNDFVTVVDNLELCIHTLERYKSEFSASYNIKNVPVMFLYESICIALIEGTSFVISEGIQLSKSSLGYNQEIKNSQKLLKNNYIKSIIKFNELERSNKLKKTISNMQHFNEAIISTTMFTITMLGLLFYLMRAIIFTFYQTRVNLTQYINNIRQYILLNSSTVTDKNVKEKQEKIAERLLKLADIISVDQDVATNRANSDMKDHDNQTSTDVSNTNDDDMGIF